MLVVNANCKEKMHDFQIPNEIKDDLVYCQRSLRHFIKVHQLLASKVLNGLTSLQLAKLKRYLNELEAEMVEIGHEQRSLVKELDDLVVAYIDHIAGSENVLIDRETANGYVTRALCVHYEMSFNTKFSPRNVTERLTEVQLAQKYELSSFDEPRPKKEKDESQSSSGSSISPTAIHPLNQKQVSLLKPKEERVCSGTKSTALPPFNNITFSNAKALVDEQALRKVESVAVPKSLVKSTIKPESSPARSPASPVLPDKQEDDYELQKLPTTAAMTKSRLNLIQALNKVKSVNLTAQTKPEAAETNKPAPANATTRQKGIMCKTKSDPLPVATKRPSTGASSDSSPNSRSSTPLSGKTSDDSSGERASYPIEEHVEPQPTDISELEQPVFLKMFGLLTLEESKALATRKTERKRRSCNSTERKDFHYGKIDYYEQQMTHIARRKHKRPILYSPPSTRGVKKRKHFEMIASSTGAGTLRSAAPSTTSSSSTSSTAAAAGATSVAGTATQVTSTVASAVTAALAATVTALAAKQQIPPPDASKSVLTEMESKICIVCNKSGTPDSLSACVYCCNIYHLRCHSNSIYNPQLLRQRDNICPVCLQKKQQAAAALHSQQRGKFQNLH